MDKKNNVNYHFLQPDFKKTQENNLKHLDKLRKNRDNFIAGMNWFYLGNKLEESELSDNISFIRGYEKALKEASMDLDTEEKHKKR